MNKTQDGRHIETIVIGGGQAGLSVGYHLKKRNLSFLILDANARVGDAWRNRWDSLRLFSPARFDRLDGLNVPAPRNEFITKDEMADYLESYAKHFNLPVRTGARVEHLTRADGHFELRAGGRTYTAENVVVAMGNHQSPNVPAFATRLDPAIRQLHSIEYRTPSQLRDGDVLVVGAGNSGAEIAKELLVAGHNTWLAGRDVGQIPFRTDGLMARAFAIRLVFRVLFHRILTTGTPVGRRMRSKALNHGGPLIRVKRKELVRLGVKRDPRVADVKDGKPVLEDGSVIDVPNVVWCTGFHPGFSWIDLPVMGEHEPEHRRGIVQEAPGLYFVGLPFLYSLSSEMIHGVGRDAAYVARHIERTGRKQVA